MRSFILFAAFFAASLSSAAAQDARSYVEGLISQTLSSEGRLIDIQGLDVKLDGDVEIDRIELQDSEGPWLTIEGVELDWSPLSLLRDQLEINLIAADRVSVFRQPFATPSAEAAGEPASLIAARIDALNVGEIFLAEALAGQDVTLTLSGSADLARDPATITARLDAERIDGIEGRLDADLVFNQTTGTIDLDLSLEEAGEGALAELLPVGGTPRVALDLDATGSADDLDASLTLALDGARLIDGTADVSTADGVRRITADLGAELTPLLPPGLAPLVAGESRLELDARLQDDLLVFDAARLTSATARLSAAGALDLAGERSDLTIDASFGNEDGTPLELPRAASGPVRIEGVALNASLTGALDAPVWSVDFTGDDLTAAGLSLQDFTLDADGRGAVPSEGAPLDVTLVARGLVDAAPRVGLPGALQGNVALDTRIVATSFDDLDIERLALETGSLAVEASGSAAPQSLGADLTFDVTGQSPDVGVPIASALLTGDVAASGRLVRDPETQALLLDGVRVTSDALTLTAEGQGNAQSVDVDVALNLTDLADIDPRLAGSVDLSAEVSGPRTAPQLTLRGSGDGVALDGRDLDRLRLDADLVLDLDAPRGAFSLTGLLGEDTLSVSADVETDDDGVRRLTDLDVRVGSARLTGALALPREGAPTGQLTLAAPDLTDVAPLALTELAGSLDADIALDADETARVTLDGADIAAAGATLGSVTADLTVADWRTQPTPSGSLNAQDVAVAGLEIPSLALEAQATAEGYDTTLTAEVSGVTVDAAANVSFDGETETTRVTLARLELEGRGLAAGLQGESVLTLGPDAVRLGPTEFAFADGLLRAEGLLSPRFDLRAELDGVRLAGFEGLAPDLAPRGRADGTLRLTGTPDAPQARFDLRVADASVAPLAEAGVPPLTASLIGALRDERLDTNFRIADAAGRPIDIETDAFAVSGLSGAGTLAGRLDELAYTFDLTAASARAAGVVADDVSVELAGQGVAPAPRSPVDLRLTAEADLSGAVPTALSGPITLDVLALLPDTETVRLNRLAVVTDALQLGATGTLDLAASTLALRLDGDAASPDVGVAAVNGLLEGDVDVAGEVRVDFGAGIYTLDGVALESPALSTRVDGTVTPDAFDLTLDGNLEALRAVDERLGGALRFDAALEGPRDAPRLRAEARGQAIVLNGTPLRGAALDVDASLGAPVTADLTLTGDLGRSPLSLSAALRQEDDAIVLRDLDASVGDAMLAGTVRLPNEGVPTGRLTFDVPDLATVAPLLLTEAAGAAEGVVVLQDRDGEAFARVEADARGLRVGGARVDQLDADLRVADYLGAPEPAGELSARGVSVAQFRFTALDLEASPTPGGPIALSLDARGDPVTLEARATLTTGDTQTLRLTAARGRAFGVPVALNGPASVSVGDVTRVDGLSLDLGGGSLRVDGTVAPDLDLDVVARAVPLSLANAVQPSLGAQGTLSGTASVSGQGDALSARFDLSGSGLSAAPLADTGFGPLDASASGTFENQRLSYRADASGPGLDLASSGSVELGGPEPVLDLTVTGSASTDPLADRLARTGVRAAADIGIDIAVAGPVSDPRITGGVTTDGATVGDAQGRFILRDVSADIGLDGDRVVVRRLTGAVGPGTLSVSGSVGLDGDLPADLAITVRGGRFADGTLVVATVDADLTVSGPLLATPTLAGSVDLVETRVTLNDLPGGSVDPIDVRHVNAPADVLAQAERLGIDAGEGGGSSGGGTAAVFLDVRVATRLPISVRGRGLTADLGGSLRVIGPSNDVRAIGAFELIRGRLDLLDRRLDFDRGRLDFAGDLNPTIDFAATADVDGAAITLRVIGRATSPEIVVSAVPDLPDDEALARLLFGRSLSDLSPLQIVRLAQGLRTLTGGGSSPLDDAAAALGFSNLEIGVDDEGNATVGVGAYVNERTYVNVEQSSAGSSRVVIDLEITDEVKARGSFDSGGSTGLGVFFEREY